LKIKLLSSILAASLWITAAHARQPPNPPPSGIVIHLFGPNSITSNILPTAPVARAAGAASTGPVNATSGGAAAPAAAPAYVEPSTSDILHQMFVTGDPNLKPGQNFAKGRTGNPQAN
jgi:hypothetical protein